MTKSALGRPTSSGDGALAVCLCYFRPPGTSQPELMHLVAQNRFTMLTNHTYGSWLPELWVDCSVVEVHECMSQVESQTL